MTEGLFPGDVAAIRPEGTRDAVTMWHGLSELENTQLPVGTTVMVIHRRVTVDLADFDRTVYLVVACGRVGWIYEWNFGEVIAHV